MRPQRAGLSNLVLWLASGDRKRAAWSMSLFEVTAGATRSGNTTANAGLAAQAGKALATIGDRDEWGGLDFLASDALVAEEHVEDRQYRLKDDADEDTPGVDPWKLDENIREARPLESVILRAAKVGPGFENEHVAFPVRAKLVAHHRPDDPPINSTWVYDPGDGSRDDWRAGLQGPVRVRPWLDKFCAAAPDPRKTGSRRDDPEETFALLLNATRSGGDNSGWLGAHFARAEAVLSAEAFGFAHPADDGLHNLGYGFDGTPIMEGGLEAFRTKFGSRGGLLYSPLAMSPDQWPFPAKSINPVLTEIREDYTDFHATLCGRAPGYKKLVTWIPVFDFGPPVVEDPPPKEDDPPRKPKYPGLIKVPFEGQDDGTPDLFGGGQGGAPSSLSGDGFWDGRELTVDDLRGDYPAAGIVPAADFGERAAAVMGQLEATSMQYRARPAQPDGRLAMAMLGETEIDNLAGLMYGYTPRQAFEQPVVADDVASADYINATPNQHDDLSKRWQPRLSSVADLSFNDAGGISGRTPARGSGSVTLMPSNVQAHWQYAENKEQWTGTPNAVTRIIMAGKNTAGVTIDGRFGFGLRGVQSGRIVSGFEFKLDTSTSATEPDLVLSRKNASGAESGAGVFKVQANVEVAGNLTSGRATLTEGSNPLTIRQAATDAPKREVYVSKLTTLGGGVVNLWACTVGPAEVRKIKVSICGAEQPGGADHAFAYEAILRVHEAGGSLTIGTPEVLINDGTTAFTVSFDDGGSGSFEVNVDDGGLNMVWNMVAEVEHNTRA